MKRKIGLLTMPLIENYGGIVQIAALYHFLESNGFEPVLIDKKYNLPKYKVILKELLSQNPFYKLFDFNSYAHRKKYLANIDRFLISFFYNRTKPLYNEKDLQKACSLFEAIVVGSDQVWRYKYVKRELNTYFLSFANSAQKKISYAASFGVDKWEGDKLSVDFVKGLISRFDAISVREDSGVSICKDTFSISNAVQVLDPTLLPELSFYESLIDKEVINEQVELYNYVLDSSDIKKGIVKQISQSLKLSEKTIHLEEDIHAIKKKKPSIAEWLYHFKHASFVVTDSFHGTVFSIIFNKPFIAIANKERGISRFVSLLKQFSLENRLLLEGDVKRIPELLKEEIDYHVVNEKLSKLRQSSTEFLLNSLNSAK